MARKKIEPDSPVKVRLTPRERELIIAHTFAGPNLTERLRIAAVAGTRLTVDYTLDDLDELVGFIAAEANHAEDARLEHEFDALYEHLCETMQSYDDGSWQESY